jgi:hypothetical protein
MVEDSTTFIEPFTIVQESTKSVNKQLKCMREDVMWRPYDDIRR